MPVSGSCKQAAQVGVLHSVPAHTPPLAGRRLWQLQAKMAAVGGGPGAYEARLERVAEARFGLEQRLQVGILRVQWCGSAGKWGLSEFSITGSCHARLHSFQQSVGVPCREREPACSCQPAPVLHRPLPRVFSAEAH